MSDWTAASVFGRAPRASHPSRTSRDGQAASTTQIVSSLRAGHVWIPVRTRNGFSGGWSRDCLSPRPHAADKAGGMIWFFHRGTERLQYEIREAPEPSAYELVVQRPDGTREVEQFPDTVRLLERSLELQRELLAHGWGTERSDQQSQWR